jgi:hypothetical protein
VALAMGSVLVLLVHSSCRGGGSVVHVGMINHRETVTRKRHEVQRDAQWCGGTWDAQCAHLLRNYVCRSV